MLKISELIVKTFKENGVEVIFGIPSIHNIGFYDALKEEPAIRHILCRHEGNATHMADGYARSSKKVGVVVASTGPGVTYTISPLIEAYCSCSPVVVVTSNLRVNQIDQGFGVLHELKNQPDMFKTVTKATVSLRPDDDVAVKVSEALRIATSGRPGPVFMEVPNDMWDMQVDETSGSASVEVKAPEVPDIAPALKLIQSAKTPMIVTGIEASHSGLTDKIVALAEKLSAPVLNDPASKGVVPEDHPLGFGNVANRGIVTELHKTCDTTISIGSRLRYVDFKRRGVVLPNLIHVDWDDLWADKNFPSAVKLIGDVGKITDAIVEGVDNIDIPEERKAFVADAKRRHDQYFAGISSEYKEVEYLRAIRKVIPREGMMVVDNTILGYFAAQVYPSYRPSGLITGLGASPIGFSFAAAIGVKLANPDLPVTAIIGDGGFLYCANELATCMQSGIAFPVIVVNDSAFRMIDYLQMANYQRGFETDLYNPDFIQFAKAFGVDAVSVDTPDGLAQTLDSSLKSDKMTLIEVRTKFPDLPFGKF